MLFPVKSGSLASHSCASATRSPGGTNNPSASSSAARIAFPWAQQWVCLQRALCASQAPDPILQWRVALMSITARELSQRGRKQARHDTSTGTGKHWALGCGFRGGLTVTAHRRQSAARAAVPRPLRSGQQTDPKPPRSPSLNSVLLTHTAPPPLRPRRSHDPAAGEEYWRFPRGWAASGKGALHSLARIRPAAESQRRARGLWPSPTAKAFLAGRAHGP